MPILLWFWPWNSFFQMIRQGIRTGPRNIQAQKKILYWCSICFKKSFILNNGSYSGCSLCNFLYMPHSLKYLSISNNLLILVMCLMPSWTRIGSSLNHYGCWPVCFMMDSAIITLSNPMIPLLKYITTPLHWMIHNCSYTWQSYNVPYL